MAGEIPNFSILKMMANGFPEAVQYYLGVWAPYHSAFRAAASAVVFPAGLLWLMFLAAKFPTDRARALIGGIGMVIFLGILLSPTSRGPEMYGGASGKAVAGAQVATGAYWSYKVPGAIYGLFKSALTSVDSQKSEAQDVVNSLAYDFQTNAIANRLEAGDVRDIYRAYAVECNAAVARSAIPNGPDAVAAQQSVGLAGGGGFGYRNSDKDAISAVLLDLKESGATIAHAVKTPISSLLSGSTYYNMAAGVISPITAPFEAVDIANNIQSGKAYLRAIPESENPFKSVSTKFVNGFKIPTKSYWLKQSKLPGIDGEPDFIDASTYSGGRYLSPDINQDVPVVSGSVTYAAYPQNCEEAFELVDLAMVNYKEAQATILAGTGSTASAKKAAAFHAVDSAYEFNKILAQDVESHAPDGSYYKGYTAGTFNRDTSGRMSDGGILDTLVGLSTDIGNWKDSIFLKYKVPFVISGCAMLVAAMITAFPIFALMSMFLGPGLLITYIKIIVFGFMVVFFNDLFLSMGADLIGVNKLLAQGAAITAEARGSNAVSLASITAEVLIYSSITVIEVMLAKILIWDDAQSISSFSPSSGFGSAMAVGGGIVAGALTVAAALIPGGGPVAAAAKTGLQLAGKGTSMATGASGGSGGISPSKSFKPAKEKEPGGRREFQGITHSGGSSRKPSTPGPTSASATNMTPP